MPAATNELKEHAIINCHTHLFTGDHVPPWLAKTFVPWPFYYLFPVSGIVGLFRFWYKGPYRWQFKPWYRRLAKCYYYVLIASQRSGILGFLYTALGIWLALQTFFIFSGWLNLLQRPGSEPKTIVTQAYNWVARHHLLFQPTGLTGKLLLVLLFVILFPVGRNLVWFLLKKSSALLGALPGPNTIALAKRYLTIGRFAFNHFQSGILVRLRRQYPKGTGFIILPMDMEYMGAGALAPQFRYHKQMQELASIKALPQYAASVFPFVFADPRRLRSEGDAHFSYIAKDGKVTLKDCFIRQYIEEKHFSGFKIYPALGYYPFDEALLPLWKYAADNGVPILTHCIRGTIYYRGTKEKAWDQHPVFEQASGNGKYEPLSLLERRNLDFINNFTHPLNYLCLLEETLLRKLVAKAKDPIKELFGYTTPDTALRYNLAHLKLCLGHFGGDDEWDRFLELDRDNISSQLVRYPQRGIQFLTNEKGKTLSGKIEQIWRGSDWYTTICSLMLQYPHVYADLSYILHNERIKPLLKQTLANPGLRTKVLFGTDFYVVRNHKSEKHLLADMLNGLTEDEFNAIARINPRRFLQNQLHP